MKAVPEIYFTAVDARDVAGLHVIAMTHPQASGERFLACTGPSLSILNVGLIMKQNLGDRAGKIPERELPNWLMRLVGTFNKQIKPFLSELGKIKPVSNEKAKSVLGWQPRTHEEAILSAAESILNLQKQTEK
jgi:dihydroflavonol-4-reductase